MSTHYSCTTGTGYTIQKENRETMVGRHVKIRTRKSSKKPWSKWRYLGVIKREHEGESGLTFTIQHHNGKIVSISPPHEYSLENRELKVYQV